MSRNDVYEALFARAGLVWTAEGLLAGTSRRLKLWADVEAFPYLMQVEHKEQVFQTTAMEYRRTLHAEWWVYYKAGVDPTAVPAVYTNDLMDSVEGALAPDDTDPGFHDARQTLGGLVHHCWMDGEIVKVPGDLDGAGLLIVPISILWP